MRDKAVGLQIIEELERGDRCGTCNLVLQYGGPREMFDFRRFLNNKGFNPSHGMGAPSFGLFTIQEATKVPFFEREEIVKEKRIELIKEFYGLENEGELKDHET